MSAPITSRTVLLMQLITLLVVAGCSVVSDHPVAPIEGSETIPEYLTGTWDFLECVGTNVEEEYKNSELILDRNADGSLKMLWRGEDVISEWRASLATVGGLQILSIASTNGDPGWLLATISFDETTQELSLTFVGFTELAQDIKLGIIDGEIDESDLRLASLTASTQELRAYFAVHGHVFTDRAAVLRKRVS